MIGVDLAVCDAKVCISAKIVVWEHVCGVFLLIINIFNVCMLLEVVWNFVLLLCTLFFVRQLCVLLVTFCGAQKKTCINAKIVAREHAWRVFLLIVNMFDVYMLLKVVCKYFFLLLCALLLFDSYVCLLRF